MKLVGLPGTIQRVVGLERNEDGAAAALGHEIEAVIEELAEERHPCVERRGQAEVRLDVRNELDRFVIGGAEQAVQAWAHGDRGTRVGGGGGNRGRVVGGLVDDQVADHARLGVEDVAAGLRVGRGRRAGGVTGTEETSGLEFGHVEVRGHQAREGRIGCTEVGLVGAAQIEQVVLASVDRAETVGEAYVGDQVGQRRARYVGFRDLDLLQDEVEVGAHEIDAHATGDGVNDRSRRRRRWCRHRDHGSGRVGEHLLHDAVRILVGGLHTEREAVNRRVCLEEHTTRAFEREVSCWQQDDVLEHAGAGGELGLPCVADVTGDPIGIGHAGNRRLQHVAGPNDAAVHVRDRCLAHWIMIEAGHQRHRLIGELQALDMRETVGPVERRGADVGHGDDVVSEIGRRAVVVDRDRVVRPEATIVGGIEAADTVLEFAHRDELTGVVGPVEHQRDHRDHAVVAGDFRACSVDVRTHADAHVEPFVAVDQVVAAAALDEVAAVTAKDDIAVPEYEVTPAPRKLCRPLMRPMLVSTLP